jgi:hypothetical protein
MEMDCKTARNLLDFARPQGHDLDAADQGALRQHLDVCTECDSFARAQHHLDNQLSRAIQDVPVPIALKDRLLKKLHQQRDDWWKQLTGRVARYAAVAAALLLITFGWFYWKSKQLLSPSTEELITTVQAPYAWSRRTPEEASDYFANKGQPVTLPPFNYDYLIDYGIKRLKDSNVPYLRFLRSSPQSTVVQYAEVFILTSKAFNLDEVEPGRDQGGYRVKVEVQKPAKDHAYVIVYTGELNDLYARPDGQAD